VTDYKVALDIYNGPLDLLLFLIKRDEIEIYDIPIARITGQYLSYVAVLHELDPEAVSEFLVLAATLMEIKSRMLLPRPPASEDDDEDLSDPRFELVRQLLEYKKFKDAARRLEHAAEERALRHERQPALPPQAPDEVDLESVDIWSLFEAFNRLLQQIGKTGGVHQVGVDDTPITLHAADIVDSLQRAGGNQRFEEVFGGRTRAEMIGLFLALLELIRQRRIRAVQERALGPIMIELLNAAPLDEVDETDNAPADRSEPAVAPFAHNLRSTGDDAADADSDEDAEATDVDEPEADELDEDAEFNAELAKIRDVALDFEPTTKRIAESESVDETK
jgi:segregation and condensation protein A